MWVEYEVNVGGGAGTGSVWVPDNASDDDIRLAIMDDLYYVNYEIVRGTKYDSFRC